MNVRFRTMIRNVLERTSLLVGRGSSTKFKFDKEDAIDFAFRNIRPELHSFADLGGVWGVDAAYTFYALDSYEITSAFLVDTDITPAVMEKSSRYDNRTLLNRNMGAISVSQQIGEVDAIFLFDVLLHQVAPDWDELLEMYAPVTRCYVVFNPQFTKSERTIRLLDLGMDEYFENVPHKQDNPLYKALFENMHDIHPQHNRIWRDIHNVWQWGITDQDLCTRMKDLGFTLQYHKNCGQFGRLKNFQSHAYVFTKA